MTTLSDLPHFHDIRTIQTSQPAGCCVPQAMVKAGQILLTSSHYARVTSQSQLPHPVSTPEIACTTPPPSLPSLGSQVCGSRASCALCPIRHFPFWLAPRRYELLALVCSDFAKVSGLTS